MTRLAIFLLAFIAGTACAFLGAAKKDPVAAIATAKAEARVAKASAAQACADLKAAEAAGLVPAGKARDDADLFCALDSVIQ